MSFFPGKDPQAGDVYACDAIDQVIVPRTVDLGDFTVRRALPSARSRMVGPFIFFDHFGPAEFRAGAGHRRAAASAYRARHRHLSVRRRDRAPRYTRHRGGDQAGRSELDDGGARHRAFRAHRRRIAHHRQPDPWLADVGGAAAGERGNGRRLCPSRDRGIPGRRARTARTCAWWSGSLYGASSPVPTVHETIFADVHLKAGSVLPLDADHEERAIYVIDGGDRYCRRQIRGRQTAGVQARRQGRHHRRRATRIW